MATSSTSSSEPSARGLRRFAGEALAFALLLLVLFGLLLGSAGRQNADDYLAATVDKHVRLANLPSPRLIFTGGSNLAFGLDSAAVAAAWPGYGVVNMGLHAGLTLPFILQETAGSVRAGDVVVLALEYEHLSGGATRGATTDFLLEVLERRPASIRYLTLPQVKSLLDNGVQTYLGSALRRAFAAHLQRVCHGRAPRRRAGGVYCRKAFNTYGDAVAHHRWGSRLDLSAHIAPNPAQFWLAPGAVTLLRDFTARCTRRQASVLLAYPALPEPYYAHQRESFDRIDADLRAAHVLPIVNHPAEMAYPTTNFFDTVYHLTRDGTRARTADLIGRLRPLLPAAVRSAAGPACPE